MFKELNMLKVFFEYPNQEFNVREISRILEIAPATASSQLRLLAEKSILKERKERNFQLYRADIESENYRDIKLYYNIRKIRSSGLINEINKFYLKPTIVLFGSFLYGLDNEESDIDIVIISEKIKSLSNKEKFERILNRRLQLFVLKSIKELKNKHLRNNVLNGLVLQGNLKWI